jgi:hypothetical protein
MNDLLSPKVAGQIYKLYEKTKNFNALIKQIDVDLKDYKFKNPFYQMKSDLPIEMYDSAIKISPGFSIGAYYNRAYSNIIKQSKNYQILVYNDLKIMRNYCYKFILQFYKYINMFQEIHKDDNENLSSNTPKEIHEDNGKNQYINQYDEKISLMFEKNHKDDKKNQYIAQCYEKIYIMERILNNVNQNINKIVDEKELECYIKKFEDNLDYLNKILNDVNIKIQNKYHITNKIDFKVSRNVIDYFSEFGIDFLFEVDCGNKNKYCFNTP